MNPYRKSSPGRVISGVLQACVTMALAATPMALAQDSRNAEAQAPEKTVVLRYTHGGAWFVSEPLKKEYDSLLARVGALRADLDANRVTGADAQRDLATLQKQLSELREKIEKAKVLVSPVKVHQQAETTEFDLGAARMLVITADNIRLQGWDGPKVKCVLEKTVIAPDGKPVDADLAGLKVVHHHGVAAGVVGRSAKENELAEQQYLASADGAKLTPAQRLSRKKLVDEIANGYSQYRNFQGKEIDTVEIEGLTYEQGNRQISVRITSPNGGGSLGSDWQRRAALTIYVPKCDAVALRGCLSGLDVKGIHAPLLITRDGSQDRDYEGTFSISDISGPVTVHNAPVDLIDAVHGNVSITDMLELVNTGTVHENDERTCYTPSARTLKCTNIEGDLTSRMIRSDLHLSGIGGRIDVKNDFGDTIVEAGKPLASKSYRVISESGKVEAHFSKVSLGALQLQALTNCGTVRTNAPQNMLETTDFSLGGDSGGAWRGLKSAGEEKPGAFFDTAELLTAVLQGKDRSPGFDLISRAGPVKVYFDQ